MSPRFLRSAPVAMGVVTALLAVVYIASPVLQSGDGRLVVYEADSLIHERNTDLSEYGPIVNGFPCYRVGRFTISRYPWGTSVVTTPLLAVAEGVGGAIGESPTSELREHPPRTLEKNLASVIAALACLVMMMLTRELTGRLAPALLIGVGFGLGSAIWSTVSRGLWQHGPLILLTGVALLLLARARNTGSRPLAVASALPLGAAFAVRPTAAIPIALLGLVLLIQSRRTFALWALALVVPIALTAAINHHLYGEPLNPFYFHEDGFIGAGVRPTFLRGLSGTMISPARGLLVYSPFAALAMLGLVWRPRLLEAACALVVLATWVSVANTEDWPGGWSYGPRLLVDTFPFLVVLLAPVADAVTRSRRTWSRTTAVLAGVLAVMFAWAVFVNARGALSWSTQVWNVRPIGASWDREPWRFFDWGDPQFLRADGNVLKDIYPHDTPPDIPPGTACEAG